MEPRIGKWEIINGRVELSASRCLSCGETFFPSRKVCLRCRGETMEQVRLKGPARLKNFTVIHQVPAGFTKPLVAGYAEFEPGVSVFAPIDAPSTELTSGSTLLDVHIGPIRTDKNGDSLIAYKFRPFRDADRG